MTRFVPWTLCALLSVLVLLGSAALAQREPVEQEPVRWFTPPPIFEDSLGDWADQELCYYVIQQEGEFIPLFFRVQEAYPTRKGKEWMLPPLVIREERKSVWRSLTETINDVLRRGR